jgi:hypothetical protein
MNLGLSTPYTAVKDPYTGKVSYVYNTPTPINIDTSSLLAALGGGGSTTSSSTTASTTPTAPTAPWSSASQAPQQSALVTAVTGGAAFFDPSAAQLDAPAGTHTADYKALFALYQGLTALQGIAQGSTADKVTSTQLAANQALFAKGMSQLNDFVASSAFKTIDVATGTIGAKTQSTAGATVETDTYTTQPLVTGSPNTPVDAFSGATAFSMQLKSLNGTSQTVDFDLSEMGSTPRSLGNVVTYLNSKLSAAGAATRFADVRIPGQAQTIQQNGQTVTVSTSADSFALKLVGTPLETVSLEPATSNPAIFLASSAGAPGATTTTVTPSTTGGPPTVATTTGPSDVVQTLTKLDTGAAASSSTPGDGTVFTRTIANETTAVRATASGPDGSVYVLGDIASKTDDGQAIKGTSDVALMKYDSAGNLLYTRTIGAANAANGYALSVSPDGSQVAVAGTTTGPLDSTDTSQGATATSGFVSVFSSAGEEEWTQTRPSAASDTPTSVTFGSNGQVIVAGTAQAAMLGGGGEVGGQDSYIQGFTGTQVTAADGSKSWTSSISFTQQFGTTGTDKPAGVAVNGDSLYVAGAENGHAVVRQYTLQATGAPTLANTTDLGDLNGGEVAGIAVASDGSIVVAGATHNGSLAGTVGQAYSSGKEGFVATLSSSLAPQAVNYVAAPSDLTATAMTLANGKVYLTGKMSASPQAGQTTGSTAYVAAIDPSTGAVGWSRTITGRDGIEAPTGIAVAQGGASSLDRLGLPTGVLSYGQSTSLSSSTSVRPGDQFQIKTGDGAAQTITIQAGDTFASLAAEINRVSGYQASATTATVNGKTVLKIAPLNGRTPVQLLSGGAGKDALSALGLKPGVLTLDASNTTASGATLNTGSAARSVLGLSLPGTLDVSTTADAKTALSALNLAVAKVENLYQDLTKPAASTTGNQTPLSTTLSNYYSSQLSNYQLALQRLGG